MTPDTALPVEESKTIQAPSTSGMTTKVVKGSLWTLAGQLAPFAISFIATRYVVRFLGSESYGVLLLIGLIPTYFTFADLGMGIASTKFASEAHGDRDNLKERDVVWTATSIAFICSLIVGIPIFLFSTPILKEFSVPENLLDQASTALKLASVAFVIGIVGSVLNSPMLARLRMDLNTVTQAVPKILLGIVTPFILYYGGGIVGAVSWTLIVTAAGLVAVFYFSGRLLPELFKPRVDRELLRPLLSFGGAWFVAMIAAMLLTNLEKFFLTKMVSVQALAYYSIAFTLANMATLFSQAMTQSLLPAFSQMQTDEERIEFNALFARSIRLNIIWLLPALMMMFVFARVFFTLWLGEEFGRESTPPFYILLVGLLFNILAYVPHASITAVGRTDIFARLYWVELAIYAVLAWVLISNFGIVGAAAAWSVRVILDAFVIISLSKRVAKMQFRFASHSGILLLSACILIVPITLTAASFNIGIVAAVAILSVAIYFFVIWKGFVDADEKKWISGRFNGLLNFQR